MKKIYMILLGIILFLIILAYTNPSEKQHRQEVLNSIIFEDDKNKLDDKTVEYIKNISNENNLIKTLIKKYISRDNYFLFSLTKSKLKTKKETIGFGILGKVFISEEKIKKLEEQEYNSSEDSLISSNQSSEISNDSGEKWLKSIFRCKGSVKYCMPSEEEVCSERFLRFYEDSWEINGPSNLTDEEYKSAVKKYKEKWSPIYQLYDSEVYLFGGGNGGTTTLKEIRVKRISIMKYDLTIEFIDGSKTNDEITLIPHNNSYKIDYVKQTKDFY